MQKAIVFLREVKQEVSKIVWPTKQEAIASTIFVVVMSIISASYFLLIDQIVIFVLRHLLNVNL